jgi:polyvinyl alcohol dehydrogenase (cytochrome)
MNLLLPRLVALAGILCSSVFWYPMTTGAEEKAPDFAAARKACESGPAQDRVACLAEVDEWERFENSPGNALFKDHCATCHEGGMARAPARITLELMAPMAIYEALTHGLMQGQAAQLSDEQRRQVAEYLTHSNLNKVEGHPLLMCKDNGGWFDEKKPIGVGWGIDAENTRVIPSREAGIDTKDLGRLKLTWAFAYLPGTRRASAQPLVAGAGIFVGSQEGNMYALDSRSGCAHWSFKAAAEIRGAAVIQYETRGGAANTRAEPVLYFGDSRGYLYALDAQSGSLKWRIKADEHPASRVVGTPVLLNDRLYVPVTSIEELFTGEDYSCCTFRGSVMAVTRQSGETIWKQYTIPAPAIERYPDDSGKRQFGPSGAGIWSTLTVDEKRGSLYFTTGDNYSAPADDSSDAIFAVDIRTGAVKWRKQTLAEDFWNVWDASSCQWNSSRGVYECPNHRKLGPDIDFTAPPVLVRAKAHADILIAGRKDGRIFGLDPDNGKIIWSRRISQDPNLFMGALYFGMMAVGEKIIFPNLGTTGPAVAPISSPDDGLYAIDAYTGKDLWTARVSDDCSAKAVCLGLASAPIGTSDVAFAGAEDGYVRAYDTQSGKVLWHFDTAREFKTLNGDRAKGGAVAGSGIMIANGMVFVNSGFNGGPGNVLLAFAIDGKR